MAEHGYRHLEQRFNLPKPNDQSNIPIQVEGTMEGTVGTVEGIVGTVEVTMVATMEATMEAMVEAMMEAVAGVETRRGRRW